MLSKLSNSELNKIGLAPNDIWDIRDLELVHYTKVKGAKKSTGTFRQKSGWH